uniref:CCHC-type domain-containing protein n=1 Tax=Magallana gigas TaxID=29159 RepID=A0A8W8KM72_MAGGI
MQNEPSIADVLAELKSQKEDIKEYVNNKISTLRQEIQGANISVSSELKKFKGDSEISWKSKGNKIQYGFNAEVQETLSSINWAIDNGRLDYAKELIHEASVKIKDRNKHIRIADSSSGGEKSKPSSTAPNPFSDYANPAPRMAFPTRLGPQQPFLQKQQFGTTPFRVGGCYVCGDFTHFQRECSLIIRSRSSGGQQDKKQSTA